MKRGRVVMALALAGILTVGVSAAAHSQAARDQSAVSIDPNIHKIKHVIVIMQENRSFDSYFGTFPGADGIPTGVCLKDPRNGGCRRPWADHHDSNKNNPHAEVPFEVDVDGGKMDGFVAEAEKKLCKPKPASCHPDVMGYHVGHRHPELLGIRQELRAAGSLLRGAGVVEPARAPVHGFRLVGQVHQDRTTR